MVLPSRVLIVGLGSIGKRHLRLLRGILPNSDIRVLRHRDCGDVPQYADGCFSTLEQAIAFAPEMALVAGPSPFHITMAQPLAQAGVHLLVEKPLSASLDGVMHLLETCRAQHTVLLTGYNLRFLPSLQRFRTLLMERTIGRVLSVRCEIGQYLPAWRPDTDYRQGVSARRELGGGVLLELSHEIDYLCWIFGDVVWINATLCRQSDLEIDVEDTAHLILGFSPAEDGRQIVGSITLDCIRHDTTRLCTVIGETGSLRWNGLTGTVEQFAKGSAEWSEVFRHQHHRDESYLAEWRHFMNCVSGQETPLVSGDDGVRVVKIVEAARQSAESGCQVRIVDVPAMIKAPA